MYCLYNWGQYIEAEVASFAKIIRNVKSDSLIFISEIFQSTHYAYDSSALWDIVDVLASKGVVLIVISHMKEFIEHCLSENQNIRFVRLNDGFRVEDGLNS